MMWLIEWVGGAHNRFKDGRDDGQTPRERAGWQDQSLVMQFGRSVQFIPFRADSRADKFDAKLRQGVWLGLDSRTDEHIIGTSYGVYRASTIKGVPEDKRWDAAGVLAVMGMPWDPTPNIDAEDAARVPNPEAVDAEVIPKDPEMPELIVRKMYIRKAGIIKHGETPGCNGCRCVALGKPLQSHTAACRERLEGLLRETEEGQVRLSKADDRVTEAWFRESERIMRATGRD